MTLKNRAWARPLLAAGVAAAALTAMTPGTAQAAQPPTAPTAQPPAAPTGQPPSDPTAKPPSAPAAQPRSLKAAKPPSASALDALNALDEAQLASAEQKRAVAVMFGRGRDVPLRQLADFDFVVAIWKHVKDNPDQVEVRLAAEAAFGAEPSSIEQACYQFITTGVFDAFDRDVAREKREADTKQASDLARTAAAASINVVADAALLNGTDEAFTRLILLRVGADAKWPKVTAAARAAHDGSDQDRQQFIATGMAEAAKQDIEDRIAADAAKTEAEKEAARSRAAKELAANRIGLTVTEELLTLPDRDFVIQIWENAPEGSEVQAAAIAAFRSLDPAVWKAFIDTRIHQAKDRDIQIALDKQEAEDRRLVQGILTRAEQAGQDALAAAARAALAGDATAVADFLRVGQFQIGQDIEQLALTTNRVGVITADATAYVNEGDLDVPFVKNSPDIKQITVSGNRIAVLTTAGVALVKEGGLHADWVTEASNVKQIALDGNRIGVLLTNGEAMVKEGSLQADWVGQSPMVKRLALSGNRIGVVLTDGNAWVKEGTPNSSDWVQASAEATQMALSGNRIGVLTSDGNTFVKEGALDADWVGQSVMVKQLALSGNRIGVMLTDGDVWVKEGAPNSWDWVNEAKDVTQMALSGNRIGVLRADSSAFVKDGDLFAAWRQVHISSDAGAETSTGSEQPAPSAPTATQSPSPTATLQR